MDNPASGGVQVLLRPLGTRLDRVGIAASVACAVHCMVAPLLLLAAPALGQVWSDPLVHWLLALVTLPAAGWVLLRGYRQHRRRLVAGLAIVGMLGILAGLVVPLVGGDAGAAGAALAADGGASAADAGAGAVCSVAGCCPSVVVDADTGTSSLVVPAASVAMLIGSICLILAHVGNLWSCRCCRSDAACSVA